MQLVILAADRCRRKQFFNFSAFDDLKMSIYCSRCFNIKDVQKKFDLNIDSHLKKLHELRDIAKEKGMLGVALRAEELRGKTRGLYVDYSKTMNVDVNSSEFKEFIRTKNMTTEELNAELQKIEDRHKRISMKAEEEYDEEEHGDKD